MQNIINCMIFKYQYAEKQLINIVAKSRCKNKE
jgi:hypothetical protein